MPGPQGYVRPLPSTTNKNNRSTGTEINLDLDLKIDVGFETRMNPGNRNGRNKGEKENLLPNKNALQRTKNDKNYKNSQEEVRILIRRDSKKEKAIKIASMNVRTLKNNDDLTGLEKEMKERKIDILGVSEIRREGEKIIQTKNGNLFCYIGIDKGQKGVGFIIGKEWKEKVSIFKGINDRLATIKVDLGKDNIITIIQVYAPTSSAEECISDDFYEKLSEVIKEQKVNKKSKLLIMGDFNSQVGKRMEGEESTMGKYNYGERNKRGWKLIRFCQEHELKIINTLFKKRKGKMWTWISPNREYKTQIDYMLAPIQANEIEDFDVVGGINHQSDHRMIKCKITLNRWRYATSNKNQQRLEKKDEQIYIKKLSEELEKEPEIDLTIENMNSTMNKWMKRASEKAIKERDSNDKETEGLPKEITELIRKREEIKRKNTTTKKERIELNLVCKIIKRKLRTYNDQKRNKMIKEVLENTESTKRIRKNLAIGKN